MQTKPLDAADEHVKVLNWPFSKLQNRYEPAAGYLGRRNPRRYPNSYLCPRLSHRRAPASEGREGYERSAQRVHRPRRKTRFPPIGLSLDLEKLWFYHTPHPDPPIAYIPNLRPSVHWKALLCIA